ncbi:MAG: homoserine dehydrogenase [Candidatus Dormibacter sp.]
MTADVGVGLIGLGTVGSAVARRLIDEWELLGERAGAVPVLRRVAVRDPARPRNVALPPAVRIDGEPEALVDDAAVAVVVEVMGGVDRASALMERALRLRKPVVTANKAALAAHGLELCALADEFEVSLRYEAAAGGGMPAVALLNDSLRGDRVTGLQMIINGTTNIILSAMERQGMGLVAALGQAQRRGFAEADPSADVDGHDAAAKLVLLSRLAFDAGFTPDDVDRTGIAGVDTLDIRCARSLGGSIKLVAQAAPAGDGVALSVRPTLVLAGHPLHGIDDADNVLLVTADLAGWVMVSGLGGGGDSTASAVVSDVVASVRVPHQPPRAPTRRLPAPDPAAVERGAYIRVRLADVPDAASLVTQALEDRGIVVVAAAAPEGDGETQLAVLTGPVGAEMLEHATETLDSLGAVDAVVAVMDAVGPG